MLFDGLPWWQVIKNLSQVVKKPLAGAVGEMSSTPGLGKSPGEGKGKPLQYSCL